MPYDLATVLQFLVVGVALGLVYSLIALGFTVIFNASGILNFAQGAFVMMGGMLTYRLYEAGTPLVVAAIAAVIATAVCALLIYGAMVRPLQRKGASIYVVIIALFGIQIVLENIALISIGATGVGYPSFVPGPPLVVGRVAVSRAMVVVAAGAILVMGCLSIFFLRTRLGHAMRAAAINPVAARLVGIRVERMVLYSFALSGALGAAAGALVTPAQFTAFNVGIPFAIKGFAAAVLGGFGSIYGATVGGLVIGMLESLSIAFLSTKYKDAITFVVLLVILLTRPHGLFASLVEEEEV